MFRLMEWLVHLDGLIYWTINWFIDCFPTNSSPAVSDPLEPATKLGSSLWVHGIYQREIPFWRLFRHANNFGGGLHVPHHGSRRSRRWLRRRRKRRRSLTTTTTTTITTTKETATTMMTKPSWISLVSEISCLWCQFSRHVSLLSNSQYIVVSIIAMVHRLCFLWSYDGFLFLKQICFAIHVNDFL